MRVELVAGSVCWACAAEAFLKHITFRDLANKEVRQGFKWHQVLSGILFGILSAYIVFAITYHLLGKMDSLALAENCGIFLVFFTLFSIISIKRSNSSYYKSMLVRTGIQATVVTASLLIKAL